MKITENFVVDRDRYYYDYDLCFGGGYEQFDTDQDAYYFGVWVNKKTKTIVTYAEGDETIMQCENTEEYNNEIKKLCKFYKEYPSMSGIDMDGNVTRYYQNREHFFINDAA
ncbi:hypothetical protein [Fangia hongkongensis]|uniref:hypothetical protein n=1 Tax=Fangia hongkongensis TaxID=270495 RepID=UPI0003607C36|nr:hypothetical protein [Fangia hongkongensis]MBK2124427.1 hypothetical protein [Fangia hongkongensis]